MGAPRKVGGDFTCKNNELTSLVGAPQTVDEFFNCSENQLTSLVGAPRKVGGDFTCRYNQLTSLEGAPQEVKGIFHCGQNPVTEKTLKEILDYIGMRRSYLDVVKSRWYLFPLDDQVLLYRPEFEWIGAEERKKLEALKTYANIKRMI